MALSSSLDSINTYKNLDEMASGLHSKKKTQTKKQRQKQKKNRNKNNKKKKWKHNESFPTYEMLKTCSLGWRCEISSFCSGEIKKKAPIIIYHGGGGERMKGELHCFQENRGGENSHCQQSTKGGGAIRHWLPMKGIIKILQSFGGGGGTGLISVWYN